MTEVWELGSGFSSSLQHPGKGYGSSLDSKVSMPTFPVCLMGMPKAASTVLRIHCLSLSPYQPLLSQGCADLKASQEKEAVEVLFLGLLLHHSARGHRRQQQGLWSKILFASKRSKGSYFAEIGLAPPHNTRGSQSGFVGSVHCPGFWSLRFSPFPYHTSCTQGESLFPPTVPTPVLHSLSDCEH